MARTLTYNEIEKLTWNIQEWCIYDSDRGGYSFYDVEADEKENGDVFYTIRKTNGSVKYIVKDFTLDDGSKELWVEDENGNIFYYEDEKVIDNWRGRFDRFDRVIKFKNPESKVKEKIFTYDRIRVYYRNGEIKDYRFDDEEA